MSAVNHNQECGIIISDKFYTDIQVVRYAPANSLLLSQSEIYTSGWKEYIKTNWHLPSSRPPVFTNAWKESTMVISEQIITVKAF